MCQVKAILRQFTFGVQRLFFSACRMIGFLILVVSVGAVITLPLWLLSTYTPTLYTAFVALLALSLAVFMGFRRIKRIMSESTSDLLVWTDIIKPLLFGCARVGFIAVSVYVVIVLLIASQIVLGIICAVIAISIAGYAIYGRRKA